MKCPICGHDHTETGEDLVAAIAAYNHSPNYEWVIGINDEYITEQDEGESLWDALTRLEARPDTWKLDLEVRDEDGFILSVRTLFEKEAP